MRRRTRQARSLDQSQWALFVSEGAGARHPLGSGRSSGGPPAATHGIACC